MIKRIIFSADENLIDAARELARAESTTLNEQFRRWLLVYTQQDERVRMFNETITRLQRRIITGRRKFTRNEMNER